MIEVYEDEIAGLEALATPPDLQGAVDRCLATREETIEYLREGLAAAERGDETGYAEAQAAVAEGQVERTRLAGEVGFEVCSVPQPAAG